jgi:protein phosphatase
VDEALGLFVIADGMGGHNAGEVASSTTVEVIAETIRKELRSGRLSQQIVRWAITKTNNAVFLKSVNNPAWEEMGTTLVMALKTGRQVVIGHVGDSRAYFVHTGKITQLTEDHTFVFEWLKQGLITKDEARRHPQRHGLTEAVGITSQVESGVSVWPWENDASLLLCSDGLTDVLEDQEILAIVETSSGPQQACNTLIRVADERGREDDISMILICDHDSVSPFRQL